MDLTSFTKMAVLAKHPYQAQDQVLSGGVKLALNAPGYTAIEALRDAMGWSVMSEKNIF